MPFIALSGGAYQSRSLIAAAQRSLNLYFEPTPQQEGEPIVGVHYCTPGLTLVGAAPQSTCRCLYTASNGDLWAVYGQQVLWFDSANQWHIVGTLRPTAPIDSTPRTTQVSMVDNGTTMLIADGSIDGWTANVVTHDGFANIDLVTNTGWLGADYLTFQDTFFIANSPGTPIFYISNSETTTFDPLQFASMTAQVTDLVAPVMVHRNLWLIGQTAYEIWINNGGDGTSINSFPFSIYPDAFGNWGCAAKYSVASIMNEVYWVSQDKYGRGLVMRGEALSASRISTHAIEYAFSQYPTISDAIGYCYQQLGHVFYVVTFPSAHNDRGATWVFDASTNEWHERAYIDDNGIEYRHLSNACAAAYDKVFVGDWRNGNLYTFDLNNYTDNHQPIKRLRSFPHQIDLEANRRVMYKQVIAQMQTGSQSEQPSRLLLDCDFAATDNTLLQSYSNINSFGASFEKLLPINAIIVNDAVVAQSNGSVLYRVAGTPDTPDYTIQYKIQPTQYNEVAQPGDIEIIGRATDQYLGYAGIISSDGTQYHASLSVGDDPVVTLPMGTLSASYYQVFLTMVGTGITLQVYRNHDGYWLAADGSWVGSRTNAIQITDDTYTAPGMILIAGDWGGSGPSVNVGIEGVEAAATLGSDLTVSANNPGLHGVTGVSAVGILTVDVH